MIRHRRGDEFLLISQHDHALVSGRLAERVGNVRFAPPSPYHQTVGGIALHDAGWPLHDDQPTLSERGEPLHVLESPMDIATRVWTASAARATDRDPYSGLLVSLHVLNLSSIAQRNDNQPHERARDAAEMFTLNKFQHQQVERQEELRRSLGMRTDIPLRLGLAEAGARPEEDLLRFNFGLLRAMDSLSLDACCSEDLFPKIPAIHPRPGEPPVDITLGHPARGALTATPWPFDVPSIELDVPCRRVPARIYASEEELREVYAAAPTDALRLRFSTASG